MNADAGADRSWLATDSSAPQPYQPMSERDTTPTPSEREVNYG